MHNQAVSVLLRKTRQSNKLTSFVFFFLQNEKRHMLMESETTKLKERDEKHQVQMVAWKAELGPRKKVRDFRSKETNWRFFFFFFPFFFLPVTIFPFSVAEPHEMSTRRCLDFCRLGTCGEPLGKGDVTRGDKLSIQSWGK